MTVGSDALDKLLIYGAGGHGRVILDAALACGRFEPCGFLDDDPTLLGRIIHEVPVLGGAEVLETRAAAGCKIILAMGKAAVRYRIAEALGHLKCVYARVVHPSAVIGRGAELGEGTVVLPMAVVHTDAHIGVHVIVNTGASVDHDAVIGNFVHLSPGSCLGGNVHVGQGTHIGLGASVLPGRRIGENAVVGAGAVVVDDVPDGVVVAGVPACVLQEGGKREG